MSLGDTQPNSGAGGRLKRTAVTEACEQLATRNEGEPKSYTVEVLARGRLKTALTGEANPARRVVDQLAGKITEPTSRLPAISYDSVDLSRLTDDQLRQLEIILEAADGQREPPSSRAPLLNPQQQQSEISLPSK
jgi:hypothetical protein